MTTKNVVLIVRQFHKIGGLEKYSLYTANSLAERGHNVTILTTGKPSKATLHNDIKFHYLMLGRGPNFNRLMRFDKECQNWLRNNFAPIVLGMDIQSFQTHIRAGYGVHAAYLDRRREFEHYYKRISFKYNPLHRIKLAQEKNAFEHPLLKKIITNSNMIKEEVLKYYNVSPEKLTVIHNGVEFDRIEKDFSVWHEEKDSILNSLKLPKSAYHFLFVGIGFKRKGLKQLLLGLSLLNNRNFTLSVVGDDKNIKYYKRLTKKLNLDNKVFFFGKRKDIRQFFKYSDCCVIPSLYDPFANVTLEALAMGVFVVTSEYNGGKEILTSSNGAVIEDISDANSMKKTLESTLKLKKTKKSAVRIRQSVKHLTFKNQLDKLINVIVQK